MIVQKMLKLSIEFYSINLITSFFAIYIDSVVQQDD